MKDKEIEEIEAAIKAIIDEKVPSIPTIPGIGYSMGAMILTEIGDVSRIDSPDKLLAYADLSPSSYESGKLKATGSYTHMEKRGSRYLRCAILRNEIRLLLGVVLRFIPCKKCEQGQA